MSKQLSKTEYKYLTKKLDKLKQQQKSLEKQSALKGWKTRNKKIEKYNASRYKKTKHKTKRKRTGKKLVYKNSKKIRKRQISAVKKWQNKNPNKVKQYRETQKRKYKNRSPREVAKRNRYLKKLRRKKQIVMARRKYERTNRKARATASKRRYRKSKNYNVQRMKPRVKVFCPKHPKEKLRKMHYVMNQKRNSGVKTTNWHFCRKCNKPYFVELIQELVLVYKAIKI